MSRMGPVVTTAELRRGVVPYCVLATLASGSANAADIVRSLAARDNLLTSVGTVYPLLGRLERNAQREPELPLETPRHDPDFG